MAMKDLKSVPEELTFIVSDPKGWEFGFVRDVDSIDLDLGDTNDFELQIDASVWSPERYSWRNRLYIPGTEYGGLLEEQQTSTKDNRITWRGYTWRGMLGQKLIYPPEGQTHLTVSGDANTIIGSILGNRFGSLFCAEEQESGIQIKNFRFDRYCSVLSGLEKMLAAKNARLQIVYRQGNPGEYGGQVVVGAVPVTDWSEELECSQDGKMHFTTKDSRMGINHLVCAGEGEMHFTTKDSRMGINHLVCAGEGEGIDRKILHLYVQKDGSIGQTQYYNGLDEREALYSYTSVEDDAKLLEEGTARLRELMNYKQMDATISDVDVEIGDIVGGRDRITGMSLQKPIVNKILRMNNGIPSVEYKLKGEE